MKNPGFGRGFACASGSVVRPWRRLPANACTTSVTGLEVGQHMGIPHHFAWVVVLPAALVFVSDAIRRLAGPTAER
jgi:hypothetical protein